MKVLVTGSAGFIGFALARRLLADGHTVIGFDGFTPYYDVTLKRQRHAILEREPRFTGCVGMLEDMAALDAAAGEDVDVVVHLAAQAGVRYSLDHPRTYVESNLDGFFNVMELTRRLKPKHFVMASTSSVYGSNTKMPFVETDRADHPMTIYAATKKAGEEMGHSYAHLWKIPTTALRFFTVYGPWGRPDMALFKFVKAGLEGEPIEVYGEGRMRRDFTYIDDLVEAMTRLMARPPVEGAPIGPRDSLAPAAPYRVVNIGGGRPVALPAFIDAIEAALGRTIARRLLPAQKGDLIDTYASADLLEDLTDYRPSTRVEDGVRRFVAWYRAHYGV